MSITTKITFDDTSAKFTIPYDQYEEFKHYKDSMSRNDKFFTVLEPNKVAIVGDFPENDPDVNNSAELTIASFGIMSQDGNINCKTIGEGNISLKDVKAAFNITNQTETEEVTLFHPLEEQQIRLRKIATELDKAEEELKTHTQELQTKNKTLENLQKEIKKKDDEIAQLKQPNAEVENLKKDLQTKDAHVTTSNKDLEARKSQIEELEKKNKELEAKKQSTQQPKQGNGALYTATASTGLAVGVLAYIALGCTARLDMLVMVGIATVSALAVGTGTYFILKPSDKKLDNEKSSNDKSSAEKPNTKVSESQAQEANGNAKSRKAA